MITYIRKFTKCTNKHKAQFGMIYHLFFYRKNAILLLSFNKPSHLYMSNDLIMKKNHITPLEYHQITKMLADKIKKSNFVPDIIVGVVRGGLIPAVYMSHLLGKIPLYSLRASTRDWHEFHVQKLLEDKLNSGEIKNVLVVDDIADSGEVIEMIKKYFINHKSLDVRFATVYTKERCLNKVDYYGTITDGRWIVFPYDIENKH